MKIAVLLSGFMCNYIDDFIKCCKKEGITTDFLKFYNEKNFAHIKNAFILKTDYKPKKTETLYQLSKEIKSLINIEEYDWIISDVIKLPFTNSCNIVHISSLNYKIDKSSSSLNNLLSKICHFRRLLQEKEEYKNTKKLIVGSSEMKRDYEINLGIDSNKIQVIFPGADTKNIYEQNGNNSNGIPFIFGQITCGFLTKGGFRTLRALQKLKKFYSPNQIKVKFINPKYKKQLYLKLLIKILGIEKYVEMIPFFDDINEFYAQINCLICASINEAFGRVVSEAMISGIPTIVASNVGASDIIEDEKNGYIFNSGKNCSKNLAIVMKKVIEKNDFKELIAAGKNTAKNLIWKNFAHQLFEVISNTKLNTP